MKTEYKRDLQSNYLVLEAPEVNEEEDYGLRMVLQNQIKGLLPLHESRMDGKRYLNYEITSRQTLESLYEKKTMGYQDILFIFSGIYNTLEEMRKYLLSWQRLLFAPELIYALPEHRGLLLCYYITEDEYPITALAEFILKRLDHRDRLAVTLGYGFYQQTSEANFSLTKTLKEILAEAREAEREGEKRQNEAGRHPSDAGENGYARREALNERRKAGAMGGMPGAAAANGLSEAYAAGGTPGAGEENGMPGAGIVSRVPRMSEMPGADEESGLTGTNAADEQSCFQKQARKRKTGGDLADRLFSKVHPAVMLAFLAFMVLLELLIVFGVLGLREAGGCFFLGLSGAVLINRRVLCKNNFAEEWMEDEEDEEYQKILREVYQAEPEPETGHEPLEETRYLSQNEKEEKLSLICISGRVNNRLKPPEKTHHPAEKSVSLANPVHLRGKKGREAELSFEEGEFPDIHPGKTPLYVGKIRGEADILLNVSTVSRMHARLEVRENVCYLKDMNSKNGTFVNGRRLQPQEECEIQAEDTVAFAEVEYRAVRHPRREAQ